MNIGTPHDFIQKSFKMAILLTGGTGYTSSQCAHLLQKANIPFVVASRKGNVGVPASMQAVKFDFSDPSTYDSPFQHQFPTNEKISAIYIVPPRTTDPIAAMNAFIDHAVEKHGVKRFVLVTGSSSEKDQPHGIGLTWRHLEEIKVEYSVLRATWFMGTTPVNVQTVS
jgi:festuclavine dehydrogenase